MAFDADHLLRIVPQQVGADAADHFVGAVLELGRAGIEELVGGHLDADHVAVLADLDAGQVGDRRDSATGCCSSGSRPGFACGSRRPSRWCATAVVLLSVCMAASWFVVSRSCVCVARTCSSISCACCFDWAKQRLQFLVVAIERGGPLLILLRLLRDRLLLLGRERDRAACWPLGAHRHLAAAGGSKDKQQRRQRDRPTDGQTI